jgi:hypothetical protein
MDRSTLSCFQCQSYPATVTHAPEQMHARVSAFTETRVCARRCVCMPTGTLHMSQQATRTTSGSDMRDHRSSGAPQCGSVRCARFGAYLPAGIALVGGCRGRVLAPAGGAGACARCGMRTRRSGGACAGLYIRMPTAVWSAERAAVDRCGVCAPTDEHPPQAHAPHARHTVQWRLMGCATFARCRAQPHGALAGVADQGAQSRARRSHLVERCCAVRNSARCTACWRCAVGPRARLSKGGSDAPLCCTVEVS